MAVNSTKNPNNTINPFQKFFTKLALELRTTDVKVLKSLTVKKIPDGVLEDIKHDEEYSGVEWIACLTKHEVIGENDVNFLIEALATANRMDLAKKAKEYQDNKAEKVQEPARARSKRASKSVNYTPSDQLHLLLATEIGYVVGTNLCKRMVNASQRALDIFCKEPRGPPNMELALVKFGNHGGMYTMTQHSNVAVLVREMSKDLNVKSCLKCYSFGGGKGGASGIADALAKFVDYVKTDEVKKEIPKLCILICFISKESSNLEYFRCPEGNDAIKLCNTLAECAIPLYIIGIDCAGVEAHTRGMSYETKENDFLSGIALIGGGQFIQVCDVNHVQQAIQCIVKENMSIEDHMGTVNDIVILERRKAKHGDFNIEHLAEHLQEHLNIRSCTVDGIELDNRPPKEISRIVQRVAWADDLDDAINAVKAWKEESDLHDKEVQIGFGIMHYESFSSAYENMESFLPATNFSNAPSTSNVRSYLCKMEVSRQFTCMEPSFKANAFGRKRKAEFNTTTPAKHHKDSRPTNSNLVISLAEGQKVSIDVARRMLRRQMTRQAYDNRNNTDD